MAQNTFTFNDEQKISSKGPLSKCTSISIKGSSIARNDRRRVSRYLKAKDCLKLIEGFTHAEVIGLPLNRHITINFDKADLPSHWPAQEAISAFLKLAGEWLKCRKEYNPTEVAWAWVREVGRYGHDENIGEHVHMAIHVPDTLSKAFEAMAEGSWLAKAGMKPSEGAIEITTAHRTMKARKGLLRYFMKGLDPNERTTFGAEAEKPLPKWLDVVPKYQGEIWGRRCSLSQSLGPKARRQFHEQRNAESSKGLGNGD